MAHVANVVIDNTKVSADLTDYVVYVNLADLPAGFWSTVANGGGDIRVYKSDGTTELAREVVSCTTADDKGELHIKYAGTLSSSTDTTIQIHADGTSSEPAVTATYGRNAVWGDYIAVWHLQEDPSGTAPQIVDSTGNGHDMTSEGSMTSADLVAGQIDKGIEFDGSNDILESNQTFDGVGDFSASIWFKTTASGVYGDVITQRSTPAGSQVDGLWIMRTTPSNTLESLFRNTPTTYTLTVDTTNTINDGAFHLGYIQRDSSTNTGYIDLDGGANRNSVAGISGDIAASTNVTKISSEIGYFTGTVDESRVRASFLSADWITTEYNNQNAPATFYTASAPGGATVNSNFFAFF